MRFERDITTELHRSLADYPVVTITGPRQSGKTTLVRTLCPDYPYINLKEPDVREIAVEDPRSILNKFPEQLIIDEIQYAPDLLSYIQAIVDENQINGQYIVTGSHQALSQSLAGRTALLRLLPLSLHEINLANLDRSTDELLLTGGYPRIYKQKLNPTKANRDYIKTYLERDVRSLINLKHLLTFQRFMKLCAARTGQILNMHSLANETGVSSHTIKHWLSILQASYIISLVPPFFENFGKQVVKSPKLYFTDVGLAAFLLGIETTTQMNRDPLRGHLFETLVVTELMKTRLNQGLDPNLYYYRDSQKNEVDILYQRGHELIAIEIKSAQTIGRHFFKGIDYFRQLVGERCSDAYLIYSGKKEFELHDTKIIDYHTSRQIILDRDE